MASGSDSTMVWPTKVPFRDKPRTSAEFPVCGAVWCLRFVQHDGLHHHVVSLHRVVGGRREGEAEELETPLYLQCHMVPPMEDGPVQVGAVHTVAMVRTAQRIWYAGDTREEIYSMLPWLYESPRLKFALRWFDHPPPELQTVEGKGYLSHVVVRKPALRSEDNRATREVPRMRFHRVPSEDPNAESSDLSLLLHEQIIPGTTIYRGNWKFWACRQVHGVRFSDSRVPLDMDSRVGTIRIQDMSTAELYDLVESLSTPGPDGDDVIREDSVSNLYSASDDYGVYSLKEACTCWIVKHLAVGNCVRFLKLADFHCDRNLKDAVTSFVDENPEVLMTPEWSALLRELPLLGHDVLQAHAELWLRESRRAKRRRIRRRRKCRQVAMPFVEGR